MPDKDKKQKDINRREMEKVPESAPTDKVASVATALINTPPQQHKDIPKRKKDK